MLGEIKKFEGYLIIYVKNYVVRELKVLKHNYPDEYPYSCHELGGWLVGDNDRGRYCSVTNPDKIRKFYDYDEAVSYIFDRKKKYKDQEFQLVYCVDQTEHQVSTLDEIIAIDAPVIKSLKVNTDNYSESHAKYDNLLKLGITNRKAHAVQLTYHFIKTKGYEIAKNMANESTFRNHVMLLKKSGITLSDLQTTFTEVDF